MIATKPSEDVGTAAAVVRSCNVDGCVKGLRGTAAFVQLVDVSREANGRVAMVDMRSRYGFRAAHPSSKFLSRDTQTCWNAHPRSGCGPGPLATMVRG
jgi:hypothetical protein